MQRYFSSENLRENPLAQVVVGVAVAYLVMLHVLKQSPVQAADRSLVFGGLVLAYFVAFGRKMPSMANLNPNLRL